MKTAFHTATHSPRSFQSKRAITGQTRICTCGHNHKESESGKQTAINMMKEEEEEENYGDEEVEKDYNVANDNVD